MRTHRDLRVNTSLPRWLFTVAALTACTSVHGTGAAPAKEPIAEARVPALKEEAALARVHEFFAAFDANEPEAFRAITTEGFFMFEFGMEIDRATFLASDRPPRTRTCTDETVRRSGSAFVYTGDCLERKPAAGDEPAAEFQGWNTVVLVPAEGDWKVALWNWSFSGIEAERSRWNMHYRTGMGFTKEPNAFLAKTIGDAEPGAALVLAMGQGRNAVYLATRGWDVTGVDLADEGIRKARAAAEAAGVEIDAVVADIDGYDFGAARWNLVTMIYAGASEQWLERIIPSMRPGGLFILEFFERPAGADESARGASREDLARVFAGWEILVNQSVEDVADWGKREAPLLRFAARKPR